MITFIEHEDYYKHEMYGVLESPKRLQIISGAISQSGILERPDVRKIAPERATRDDVISLHSRELFEVVKKGSEIGGVTITPDTMVNEYTFQAALRSVGGAILAGELALKERNSIAYVLTRPPGHHATWNQAMGFCFFNNVALAVNHLISKKKAKRIAIIDYDNHYGNGTAELFYERSDVLYLSLHADPNFCFPFYYGRAKEIGEGEGKGHNICIPLPVKTGDKEFLEAFDRIIPPVIRSFKPDLLFVSAGYDALDNDPYGVLGLSINGFQKLTEKIFSLSREVCDGKIALALEGGYKFDVLGAAFMASIYPLLPNYRKDHKKANSKLTSGGHAQQLKKTLLYLKGLLGSYWDLK